VVKMRPGSRIREVVYASARDMLECGSIDSQEMAEFESLCLVPVPHYLNGRKIRKLRRRYKLKQERLAQLLNTRVVTVRRWEAGQTKPRGAALRLLEQLEANGPEALVRGSSMSAAVTGMADPARRAG